MYYYVDFFLIVIVYCTILLIYIASQCNLSMFFCCWDKIKLSLSFTFHVILSNQDSQSSWLFVFSTNTCTIFTSSWPKYCIKSDPSVNQPFKRFTLVLLEVGLFSPVYL